MDGLVTDIQVVPVNDSTRNNVSLSLSVMGLHLTLGAVAHVMSVWMEFQCAIIQIRAI